MIYIGDIDIMIYQSDSTLGTFLLDVYDHLKADYDMCLIISGDTGSGKSMLALNILETWYKVILKKDFTPEMIDHVHTDFNSFVKKFKEMKEYDLSIMDEGSVQLDSKAHMEKMSRQITKLYNVFRCKKFFTIIILPSYFNLNKYFREHRLRGAIWVNKRGKYKLYTKKGVNWLNALNERRSLKNMNLAYPIHYSTFPDYKGILREPYERAKMEGVDKILDEVIAEGINEKSPNLYMLVKEDVKKMKEEGYTIKQMREKLEVGSSTIQKCLNLIKNEGL
tara:strand:- start:2182 stop:3018 length:837 start_codon:yes stop_codon:yes gene_type:complete